MAVRLTYMLIEEAGERMLVKSLDGHDGAIVIADRVPEPPSPNHRLDATGKWVVDPVAVERARLKAMTREEVIEEAVRRSVAAMRAAK